jgi:hypothetical protein
MTQGLPNPPRLLYNTNEHFKSLKGINMKTLRYLLLAFGTLFVALAVATFFGQEARWLGSVSPNNTFTDNLIPNNYTLFWMFSTAAAMCFIIRWGLLITKYVQGNEPAPAHHGHGTLIMFYIAAFFSVAAVALSSAYHSTTYHDTFSFLPMFGTLAWAKISFALAAISWATRWAMLYKRSQK